MKKNYTEEFRQMVVADYKDGRKLIEICAQYDISTTTIYNWVKLSKNLKLKDGSEVTVRQFFELKRDMEKMTMENEILKKINCTQYTPVREKLKAIAELEGLYPIRVICKSVGVLHSTYYHYKRSLGIQSEVEKTDIILKPIIKKLFKDTKGRLGSRKMSIVLKKQGVNTGAKRIRRLMNEMGLVCRASKKHFNYNFSRSSLSCKDLVNRNFNPDHPNNIWVSDITYVRVNYKAHYICTVIDLFSRKVIGFSTDTNQETPLVINAFKNAYNSRKTNKGMIFHSDQGMQYTSKKFRELLIENDVQSSFSRAGCPYDNSVAESFFRTLKQFETNHTYYKTHEELKASLEEFIDFFNNVRPHESLNYLTPNEREEKYYKNHKKWEPNTNH